MLDGLDQERRTADLHDEVSDRRRPGRADIQPALVELLRDPTKPAQSVSDDDAWVPMEPEKPKTGIGLGLGVLVLAWLTAGAVGYTFL